MVAPKGGLLTSFARLCSLHSLRTITPWPYNFLHFLAARCKFGVFFCVGLQVHNSAILMLAPTPSFAPKRPPGPLYIGGLIFFQRGASHAQRRNSRSDNDLHTLRPRRPAVRVSASTPRRGADPEVLDLPLPRRQDTQSTPRRPPAEPVRPARAIAPWRLAHAGRNTPATQTHFPRAFLPRASAPAGG